MKMKRRHHILRELLLALLIVLPACGKIKPAEPEVIILRNWEGDISQEILDDFTEEFGIEVTLLPYDTQEQAIEEMRSGEVYDVVVLENQLIPPLVADGLLADINYQNVPNFKNISPNFRDLAYDPGNAHAIPYSWGITGMVVRTDLVAPEVTSWNAMWNPGYRGKVIGWPLPRYMMGVALKSLGYSLNSEVPAELEAARDKLIELKPNLILLDWAPAVAAPYLVSGEAVVALGQADDVIASRASTEHIEYVIPREGGILWGDNFTIPANTSNKEAAETLINYLLRAEVSARIVNETYYWLPNDAALPLIDPEIKGNTAIFPTEEMLLHSEILLPLSEEGMTRHQEMWDTFMKASTP